MGDFKGGARYSAAVGLEEEVKEGSSPSSGDAAMEEGNETGGAHPQERRQGSKAELQSQILEESNNGSLQDTKLAFEQIIAVASVSASTPSGTSDEDMGADEVEEEDEDDAEDADAANDANKGDPWDTEWMEGRIKEASPLQLALIKVNTLRLEIEQDKERIGASEQGGPTYCTRFLRKNHGRRMLELASSIEELSALQLQADTIQKTQIEAT